MFSNPDPTEGIGNRLERPHQPKEMVLWVSLAAEARKQYTQRVVFVFGVGTPTRGHGAQAKTKQNTHGVYLKFSAYRWKGEGYCIALHCIVMHCVVL